MRLQGMLPAKSTAGVTAVQMGRSGRQRRHLLWFWDTRSDYTLVALLIVILNKDEVVSCRTKHNKTVESAKMGTRAKISDELRGGGGIVSVRQCVWWCGYVSRLWAGLFFASFPVELWCRFLESDPRKGSLTEESFWLIRAL